jgi:hypothetical protein
MAEKRTTLHGPVANQRRPPTVATVRRSAADSQSTPHVLARHLGNQRTQALIARSVEAGERESSAKSESAAAITAPRSSGPSNSDGPAVMLKHTPVPPTRAPHRVSQLSVAASAVAPMHSPSTSQLSITTPGDASEREADNVADILMRMAEPRAPETLRPSTARPGPVVQRKCTSRVDEHANKLKVHRKADAGASPKTTPDVAANLGSLTGGGTPLPAATRAFFERRFGADFSHVRVHTDTHAARTAGSIDAKAFTVGSDIAFADGQYARESQEGRSLLAHELTHGVQQGGERPQRMPGTERPAIEGDQAEGPKGVLNSVSPTAGQAQAVPGKEPRDESIASGSHPVSVMVGGGGGGAGHVSGGSEVKVTALSPERQTAAIIADSVRSEQEVKGVATARRREISTRFGAIRGSVTGLLASSSAAIQQFLGARKAEVQTTAASVLTAGRSLLMGTVNAAQGQIQQARAMVDGIVAGATTALQSQITQTAGRITGFVDMLALPDLPGVATIRAGARALASRAASAVTAALGQVRALVSAALRQGVALLGSLMSTVGEAANSALSRIGSMIQTAVQAVVAGLSRIGAALLDGLRRALNGTVIAGLRQVESRLSNNLTVAERHAITAIHKNRDEHVQAARDGRAAADGSSNLAEEARLNNVAVVTTFRERVTGLLGSIFNTIAAGAAALVRHMGQLVSRVIAILQPPVNQILAGLRQVGKAISGFVRSLVTGLADGIASVVGFVRSLIQAPLDAVIGFATRAVSNVIQFFTGLPARLLGGNLSLPGVAELVGDTQPAGPIIKPPPPGTIVKPILTFLGLLFLTVGAIVLYFAPSIVAAVAAVLLALGITVAPVTLLIIVGVVVVLALIALLVLLYLLYELVKPGPKPPPPVITHQTNFSAPDGSPNSRDHVGVGEIVVFTGSASGTWTASAGSPRTGTGSTFTWTAPERRRTVTIRLTVGRGKASATMNVLEPDSIVGHKLTDQKPAPGKFGAGMFLDFELQPLRVSFGRTGTREVEGPASSIKGYYKRFSKKDLHHNPGPVQFFPIGENNRFANAQDDASWLDQPPPFSDGSFQWKIPNKFQVVTESGDGKKYTTVTQEFGMEASGKARVEKAGAHTEHP